MGYMRITSDLLPVENTEGNLIASAAKTTTQTSDFMNPAGRQLYVVVDVTAVTAGVKEVATLTVTGSPTVAGNVTVTLGGVAFPVAVDPLVETTADLVAAKIRGTAMTGWVLTGTTNAVIFTAAAVGTKTNAAWSAGTTTTAATIVTTAEGTDSASLVPTFHGRTVTGNKPYLLGTAPAITAIGTYAYLLSNNAGVAAAGITAAFDVALPKSLRAVFTVANTTSMTYSVDYALSL